MMETSVHSFCRFCPAACGVVIDVLDGRAHAVHGDTDHAMSNGYVCPKGMTLIEDQYSARRLHTGAISVRGEQQTASVAEVLDDLAAKLSSIVDAYGPDAVATFRGNAAYTDRGAMFVARRFMEGLGTASRYSTRSLDAVSKEAVGALMGRRPDFAAFPIMDTERATLTVLVGTNPVVSHGHDFWAADPVRRIKRLRERGELWVIDPRRTETARLADRHIAPRPGTDYAVLAYMVGEILRDGSDQQYLADHAINVDVLRSAVAPFTAETVSAIADVDIADVDELVSAIRRHGRLAGKSGTGLSMSANPCVPEWLLWALHIVTGSFERPGGLWFNPDFFVRVDRRLRDAASGLTPSSAVAPTGSPAPSRPELAPRPDERPSAALVDEIEQGNVRALVVFGGNPVLSMPGESRVAAALRSLDVLAVIDVARTGTTDLATHVLPARSQLERSDLTAATMLLPVIFGQHTSAVVAPTGDAQPMWRVFAELGRRMHIDVLPDGLNLESSDDDVLSVAASRADVPFEELRRASSGVVSGGPELGWVEELLLPDGRWDAAPSVLVAQLEALPLVGDESLRLVPRRQRRHLNYRLTTLEDEGVRMDAPEFIVNPVDAGGLNLIDGQQVTVRSEHGELSGCLRVDDSIREGAVSIPHGFELANVNALTSTSIDVDPVSGMVRMAGVELEVLPS
ncbi:MAG: molybdopterin oxidoreductase [Mycobacterium sp.]|nr:molybdopterin oxidoreductase [Mycobacterium sp.]